MSGSKKQGPTLRERRSNSGRVLCYAVFNGRFISFGAADDPETRVRFQRFKAEWEANARQLPAQEQEASPSLDELADAYEAHAKVYYRRADGSQTGEATSITYALKPLRALYGGELTSDFTLAKLKSVRDEMVRLEWARSHVNRSVSRVVRMFAWAADELRVAPEVFGALRALRPLKKGRCTAKETTPRRPVAEVDVRACLPYLPAPVRGLVLFCWHTAARIGEAVQVCSRDVDMTGAVWVFQPRRHKLLHRDRTRIIAIGPEAQRDLRAFVKLAPDAPWFSPKDAVREQRSEARRRRATPLWASHVARYAREAATRETREIAERYTSVTVAHALQRAAKLAGVDPWSAHALRHAALTRIRREKGIEAAAAIAGHSSASMTELYSHQAQRDLALKVAGDCG